MALSINRPTMQSKAWEVGGGKERGGELKKRASIPSSRCECVPMAASLERYFGVLVELTSSYRYGCKSMTPSTPFSEASRGLHAINTDLQTSLEKTVAQSPEEVIISRGQGNDGNSLH
jgi:hypothetical protein